MRVSLADLVVPLDHCGADELTVPMTGHRLTVTRGERAPAQRALNYLADRGWGVGVRLSSWRDRHRVAWIVGWGLASFLLSFLMLIGDGANAGYAATAAVVIGILIALVSSLETRRRRTGRARTRS